MTRGDKSKYTDKQKRQAGHIEQSYGSRGVPEEEAEARAWATVNKQTGGGNKRGSGRGVPDTTVSAERGGKLGGKASAAWPPAARSASARKAAATREGTPTAKKAQAGRKGTAAAKKAPATARPAAARSGSARKAAGTCERNSATRKATPAGKRGTPARKSG